MTGLHAKCSCSVFRTLPRRHMLHTVSTARNTWGLIQFDFKFFFWLLRVQKLSTVARQLMNPHTHIQFMTLYKVTSCSLRSWGFSPQGIPQRLAPKMLPTPGHTGRVAFPACEEKMRRNDRNLTQVNHQPPINSADPEKPRALKA